MPFKDSFSFVDSSNLLISSVDKTDGFNENSK